MNKMNKKGFTLIEMLIVIAIIAVLVSIVIPVVSNSTEKAREAADAANIRSAIAEVTTAGLSGDTTGLEKTVKLTQDKLFDQNEDLKGDAKIGGFPLAHFNNKTQVVIKFDTTNNCVLVDGKKAEETPAAGDEKCTYVDEKGTVGEGGTETGDGKCDKCGKAQDEH